MPMMTATAALFGYMLATQARDDSMVPAEFDRREAKP